MSGQNLLVLLIGMATFILLACIWAMVVIVIGSRRHQRAGLINQRLDLPGSLQESTRTLRLWHEGQEATTQVRRSAAETFQRGFARRCMEAGWETPPQTILVGLTGAVCGAFALCLLVTGSLAAGMGAAVGMVMLFRIYLTMQINRRRKIFENQLVDALELAARSLRVGHPLPSAFRLASEEIAAPVGVMFASIVQQQELGVPLDEAVNQAAVGSNSDDFRLFATAVIIQISSGGNLADMMERVVAVMRDRMRLTRRVRVLTAQTQFSKQVLLALPVGMFVLLNFMNPEYMRTLYNTSSGRMILMIATAMLALGAYIMGKLAIIRY
jgi:tight adherence protein B